MKRAPVVESTWERLSGDDDNNTLINRYYRNNRWINVLENAARVGGTASNGGGGDVQRVPREVASCLANDIFHANNHVDGGAFNEGIGGTCSVASDEDAWCCGGECVAHSVARAIEWVGKGLSEGYGAYEYGSGFGG